jgi:hypothetical protein
MEQLCLLGVDLRSVVEEMMEDVAVVATAAAAAPLVNQ